MATRAPSIRTHAFAPAAGEPEAYDGARVCADCHKPGRTGDAQHPHGAPPMSYTRRPDVPAAARDLDARILGERHERD